jgi:hypothetical protein
MGCLRLGWVAIGLTSIALGVTSRCVAVDLPTAACSAAVPASPDAPLVNQKNDFVKAATDALSENADLAQAAIKSLREAGPAGLEALLSAHREIIEARGGAALVGKVVDDGRRQRLLAALDAVGGQRDCLTSRLFWYTDLNAAKAAAKESGKPILSLRLLGKLTDEFSCANSRFFRTTLYANEEVSKVLRDRFILHWESVRPVPKVTIDFGDGRKLERTLTGNSIHYVLDSEGRVIDALPGLYGPKAFLRGLEQAADVVTSVKAFDDAPRTAALRNYHQAKANEILAAWQHDLAELGSTDATKELTQAAPAAGPRAVAANAVARPKRDVEQPLVAAALADAGSLSAKTDDAVWARIAQLHQADSELDAASIALIRSQNPTAGRAMPLAASKARVEDPMLRLVQNFQNTIAIDTARNEYTFHRQIHEWFAAGEVPMDIEVNMLNDRVYAQLFLTPGNDPWLGLVPGDVYTALDNNGLAHN